MAPIDEVKKFSAASTGFIKEFREFAIRGNVVDMAVGVIIGAAFGKIVSSLVSDVLMPPIGLILGGVNFSGLEVTLKHAADKVPAVTMKYGIFIQTIVDFTIVAAAVFFMVKLINRLRRNAENEKPAVPPAKTIDQQLLTEIRDLLQRGR